MRRGARTETEARDPRLNFFLERCAEAYKIKPDHPFQAVETGRPVPVASRDGRQALRLADCGLESVLAGRTVAV